MTLQMDVERDLSCWSNRIATDESRPCSSMDTSALIGQLQQHILKLCNEKVTYIDKLQILGVVCLSIDDVPHEVIIKLNSTLKKVDSSLSPVTLAPSPGHLLTPPPTLPSSNFPVLSRRKRTVPIRHVDAASSDHVTCGAGGGAQRDASSFAPTSSSEEEDDDDDEEHVAMADPCCKLQLGADVLVKSPSEPGEVKRVKYEDDALDFTTTTKTLQEIDLPFDFSRSNNHSESPLTLAANPTFNSQPVLSDNDILQQNPLKNLIKPIDNLLNPNFEQIRGYRQDRHENEFMVDKLGLDGKKRRRRAPDESLTSEEILEYMGGVQPTEIMKKEGEKFTCQRCYEQCEDLSKYLKHTMLVHSAYICHECGRNFTTKSSLLRHRPIHTGMRRFACGICKKAFYRKDKCKAHIKRHLLDYKTDLSRIQGSTTTSLSSIGSPGLNNLHRGLSTPPSINPTIPPGLQLLPHNIHLSASALPPSAVADISHLVSAPQISTPPGLNGSLPTLPLTFSACPPLIKQEKPADYGYGCLADSTIRKTPTPSAYPSDPSTPSPAPFLSAIKIPAFTSARDTKPSPPCASAALSSTTVSPLGAPLTIPSVLRSHPVPTTTSLQANTIAASAFKIVDSI